MVDKKNISDEFVQGKERLSEIGRRLGAAFGTPVSEAAGSGILNRLGSLVEQIGKLAEQAEQAGGVLNKSGEFKLGSDPERKGVYGFSIKSGLGDKGVKVEPFGNIRKDGAGKLVAVHEIREPMVDLFDESNRLLIVAEVPGIEEADLQIELNDDILLIATKKGEPNYRKELLLTDSFAQKDMSFHCRNGVLQIVLKKTKVKGRS